MDDYLTIVATLLGAAIGGIIGFAGAYLVERQRFQKERVIEMRDKIYGPMLMATSRILEAVKLYQNPIFWNNQDNLKKLQDDYLFFTLKQDLKSRFTEVMDRLEKYQKILRAAEIALDAAALQYFGETLGITKGISGGAENAYLRLLMGQTKASSLDMKSAIFLKMAPQDFIKKEKEKWGEGIQIDVSIFDYSNRLEAFESMYASMLAKMEKEPLYMTEREQRTRLAKELENLIEQIEPFVKTK